ncbi:tetratricopeptide repeat protein [Tsuneonella sp. HG249]
MIRQIGYATLVAATSVLSTTSAPSSEPSEAVLALLDPTRIARTICGGTAKASTERERQLRLAAAYAESAQPGVMKLAEGIGRSQIPASGLEGDARRYFDQGLALTYGFNHKAAIAAFREARRRAPDCAMCAWGEALANGPNINAGMDDAQNAAALAALVEAERTGTTASPLERALIAAQKQRYSAGADAKRADLDAQYADAMFALAKEHPANDDLAVLAAEAAMNTTPWNYWQPDRSTPQPRVADAVALIEGVVARNPSHPQASHLYIHLMENNIKPEMAEAAADRLVANAPPTLGHLVHMPAHIYYRIGRYADSMRANVDAARADEQYIATIGDDGLYRYGYYPHNVHFLLASAQMVGAMHTVAAESHRLTGILSPEIAQTLPWVQAIHAAPAFALAQYASPEAILALNSSPSELAYVEAMRRYARAVAHAHQRDGKSFDTEIAALDALEKAPGVVSMADAGFPAADLVKLAGLVARAKQAQFAGRPLEAIELLEKAEAIEATIPYNEPPYWYYPVAQTRGGALYQAGRYAQAREAFMKALIRAPNDSWALWGLAQTERKLGNRAEAMATERAFEKVWMGDRSWLRMERL